MGTTTATREQQHRHLYPLGLEDRDRLNSELGGGIPQGSIVLIEGDYGAGKSVMSQRFTYGLCTEGFDVTLLSTELTVTGFLDQMDSLDYNVEDYLLDEELLFLHAEVGSDGSDLFSDQGTAESRKKLLKRLMDAETMWQADVIVVDTFDAILRNDPTFEALVRQNEERQAALEIISFFRTIIADGRTVVLTVDPTNVEDDIIGPFRSIADVFAELEMIEVGTEVRRQMTVKRFAGMGEQVGDSIGYSVRADTGIVIESRNVA